MKNSMALKVLKSSNFNFVILIFLAIAGIFDAGYLTYQHYNNIIPPCTTYQIFGIASDCDRVLQSQYNNVFGLPVALIGLIHYIILIIIITLSILSRRKFWRFFLIFQTIIGLFVSLYLMYLQLIIIRSLCLYCTLSAIISFLLLIFTYLYLKRERLELRLYFYSLIFQNIFKPIFFLIDPETVHELMISFGEFLGKTPIKNLIKIKVAFKDSSLKQKIAGINFNNPIGLAAGFDYDAKLTQILPSLNFGFETVGTITNLSYQGNPKPRLGRLPKSYALMVNKGFKSLGAKKIIEKLEKLNFDIPIGISIGRTNSPLLKTQKQSVEDIVHAFSLFEKSKIGHSYYELNISCPNLIYGLKINFYTPDKLEKLLTAIEKLRIKKPVLIKMPIEKSDKEFLTMLEVIVKFKFVKGVIIGNLQKNRKDPSLYQEEVKKFRLGNFSGKPCKKRSNELIRLTYQKYKKGLFIIGCGGVFDANDAYEKIRLGASLVQLITGMVYQGPQLISQINLELVELLHKDGYKHISEAVGTISS